MHRLLLTSIAILLSACAQYTPIIPSDYRGELATINDTFKRLGTGKAEFFYIESVNGQRIPNALSATGNASYGKGRMIVPIGATRDIPAEPIKLNLVAQSYHSAPIGYLFDANNNYEVSGAISFTPEANVDYLVKGRLGEDYSAVWLEDIYGNIVSDTVEFKDSQNNIVPKQRSANNVEQTPKETREDLFSNISGGESRDLIIKKLGEPNNIVEHKANFFTGRNSYSVYTYNGLGDVHLTQYGMGQYVNRLVPKVDHSDGGSISLSTMLETNDPITLQQIAKSNYQSPHLSENELDLMASKVWSLRESKDSYMVDALSWFCKVLGKSKNPRYRKFLESLLEEDITGKLKRYAKSSLKSLPKEEAEQFKPGIATI